MQRTSTNHYKKKTGWLDRQIGKQDENGKYKWLLTVLSSAPSQGQSGTCS